MRRICCGRQPSSCIRPFSNRSAWVRRSNSWPLFTPNVRASGSPTMSTIRYVTRSIPSSSVWPGSCCPMWCSIRGRVMLRWLWASPTACACWMWPTTASASAEKRWRAASARGISVWPRIGPVSTPPVDRWSSSIRRPAPTFVYAFR
ncbi:conserved hypothetical protein [Mycobacterium marinum E11]|nr:conserved hypothetical protein [Mycobacterium marinum E11]